MTGPAQNQAETNRAKGSWKLDLIKFANSDAGLSPSDKSYLFMLVGFADNNASPVYRPRREAKIDCGGMDASTQRKAAKNLIKRGWLEFVGPNALGMDVFTITAGCMFEVQDNWHTAMQQLNEAKATDKYLARSKRKSAKGKRIVAKGMDDWDSSPQDALSGPNSHDDLHMSGPNSHDGTGQIHTNPLDINPQIQGIEKKERGETVINRDSTPSFDSNLEALRGAA